MGIDGKVQASGCHVFNFVLHGSRFALSSSSSAHQYPAEDEADREAERGHGDEHEDQQRGGAASQQ